MGEYGSGKVWFAVDISLLKEFTVLAQSETFLKAADLLYISQPTLSRHIKNLESELGVSLFERTTRSSKLTKHGQMFLPYAQKIVELYGEFSDELAEERSEKNFTLRIGSIAAMDNYGITGMITRFKELYPQVKTNIVPRHNISFLEMLQIRNCDLVFARETTEEKDDNINRLPVMSDHLAAVVPDSSPLAELESITLEQLRNEDLVTLPDGTSFYQMLIVACEARGFEPNLVLTHHSIEHLFNCVKVGTGIAILSNKLIEPEWLVSGGVKLLDITPALCTNINLCYPKNMNLSEAAMDFIRMYEEEFSPKG